MPFKYKCGFQHCYYATNLKCNFDKHYIRKHKDEKKLIISCTECEYTGKSWVAFRKHVQRCPKLTNTEIDLTGNINQELRFEFEPDDIEYNVSNNPIDDLSRCAKFALECEAEMNITQRCASKLLNRVHDLILSYQDRYKSDILKSLNENDNEPITLNEITKIISDVGIKSSISSLNSHFKRQKFYTQLFSMITPKEVVLGQKSVLVNGQMTCKNRVGYVIPLKENLTAFISMPEVWDCIKNPQVSPTNIMTDIKDGEYIRKNALYLNNDIVIEIILNTDDLEVANPLGAKTKKHKVSMFYFSILNLYPALRSSLNSIQLVAVARSVDIQKVGCDLLLDDFIKTVNQLSTIGMSVNIDNATYNIKGSLIIAPCDTLASHFLGGFKGSVSFAHKGCRHCNEETHGGMKTKFLEDKKMLRSDLEHKRRCKDLDSLSGPSRKIWSKQWGINGRSPLLKLINFDFCTGLVQDPMHVLLEGIIPVELAWFLKYAIYERKLLTLGVLNNRLETFNYKTFGTDNNSKPIKIEKLHIENNKIKQNSSGMIVLCKVLPFLIGDAISDGDRKWLNILRLIQILSISISPNVDVNTQFNLEHLIEVHNTEYAAIYQEASIIPKLHYLVHFPSQLSKYGPLRNHWVMRFEGKHRFFTSRHAGNFKNIAKTFADKHEKFMCNERRNADGSLNSAFLYKGDVLIDSEAACLKDIYPEFIDFNEMLTLEPEHMTGNFQRTNKIYLDGHVFERGCIIMYGFEEMTDEPCFGHILDIFIKTGKKYFVLQKATIKKYNIHLLSYAIENDIDSLPILVSYAKLLYKWPYHAIQFQNELYLPLFPCHHIEDISV